MGEYRNTKGQKPLETDFEKKKKALRNGLRFFLFFAAIAAAMIFIKVPKRVAATGYATTSPYAEVRSPISGIVMSIDVKSGDLVKKGDLLVSLYDEPEKAALLSAKLEAERAKSELDFYNAQYAELMRSHSNEVQIASLSLKYAEERLGMTRQLTEKGLASIRDLMADEHQAALARLTFRQLSEKDMTTGRKEIEMLERKLASAEAGIESAETNLEARRVRAPSDGMLFKHTFFVGEVVRSDQILFEIFGDKEKLLRLKVAERYATKISEGMAVRAQFRSAKKFLSHNWVCAEIADMRDIIQSEGNNSYRIIYCPYKDPDFDVPPGTTADADIMLGKVPLWRFIIDR